MTMIQRENPAAAMPRIFRQSGVQSMPYSLTGKSPDFHMQTFLRSRLNFAFYNFIKHKGGGLWKQVYQRYKVDLSG